MSEIASVTALNGARYDGIVEVAEMPLQGMITLRGKLGAAPVKNAAIGIGGVDMPDDGMISVQGDRAIAWMSPDELLIFCAYDEVGVALTAMERTLDGSFAMAVDVSDARAMFRLEGAAVRDVLAKLTPADMSVQGCPPGRMRRTRLAQVAAAIWLTGETTAHIVCFRSVAPYVFGLLSTAAQPGSDVGYY
ncbi:sarcosine oxidase subunit gamma [Chachezhania sediminis]|uniref:sarcosine oxidase subunit gamma n=1 Tax=Chachezhania sediminis TaxID=2599291 RepID=UPI00131B9A04|nr:sarcosine oxidase subunit gamma family protein [Chachezhania sediminis]